MSFMGSFKRKQVPLCNKCKLDKKCRTPKFGVHGEGKKRILLVMEYPSDNEDVAGLLHVGSSGQLLETALLSLGISLNDDCWSIPAVCCKPTNKEGGPRAPSKNEIENCRPTIQKLIADLKPHLIIAFGPIGVESIFGDRFSNTDINRWRRYCIPDPNYKCWVVPLHSPAWANKLARDDNAQMVFHTDLKFAISALSKQAPTFENYAKRVRTLIEFTDVMDVLERILKEKPVLLAHDYESNCKKPYKPGTVLHTVSVCWSPEVAYAFPLHRPGHWTEYQQKKITRLWTKILASEEIGKTAHNLQMEHAWSSVKLGVTTENWVWDTMIGAHITNSVTSTTGLKFQSFVQFGVNPYEGDIHPFLVSAKDEEFNTIHKAPLQKLLLYNGLDSLFNYLLVEKQQAEIKVTSKRKNPLYEAYKLFHEGSISLCEISVTGFACDENYFNSKKKELEDKAVELTKEILSAEEARTFRRHMKRAINPGSDDDLRFLLYDLLGIDAGKQTAGGSNSVDAEVLTDMNHPFTNKILELRKVEKISGTFLAQFLRESYDNRIHTNFNLNIARSGRSSSNSPNFQNIPKRDKAAKLAVRSGIVPKEGFHFAEVDYGSLEVRIFACHTKDPALISFVCDPTTDMHRDEAIALFILDADQVSGPVRFEAKNGWVFAQFYGSYYKNCASKIWAQAVLKGVKLADGVTTLKDHLSSVGIMNVADFTAHLKDHETKFWDKYHVTREYQKNAFKEYLQNGYIQTMFGFRRYGYLNRNKIINTPTQGCLAYQSKVLTSEGHKEIGTLVGKQVTIWTGFKWAKAVGVDRGVAQRATIKLDSGLVIECDTRHFLKNTKCEWVSFEDLNVGDYVALPKMERRAVDEFEVKWPFVLGYYIGDGSWTTKGKGLGLCGGQTKIPELTKIFNFLKGEGFNPKLRVWGENEHREEKYAVSLYTQCAEEKFESFGIECGLKSKHRRIPKAVWGMSFEDQWSFVEGYLAADGCRKKWRVVHTPNLLLLQDFQVLLSGLGIDSMIRAQGAEWELHLRDQEKISNRVFPRMAIPEEVWNKKYKGTGATKSEAISTARAIKENREFMRQHMAERIMKEMCPEHQVYRFDKIVEIIVHDKFETTYTMSVEDELHQFVADGVIHKNTGFQCLLWSINQLRPIFKREQWQSQMIGQIHDSLILELHPTEIQPVLNNVHNVMCEKLRADHNWLITPMEIEVEMAELGGSWYDIKPMIKGDDGIWIYKPPKNKG